MWGGGSPRWAGAGVGPRQDGGAGWGGRGPEIIEHKNSHAFYESPGPDRSPRSQQSWTVKYAG